MLKLVREVLDMCNNGFFGGNNCWCIILVILLLFSCGNGCGNSCGNIGCGGSCGCNNGCGCDNNCGCGC